MAFTESMTYKKAYILQHTALLTMSAGISHTNMYRQTHTLCSSPTLTWFWSSTSVWVMPQVLLCKHVVYLLQFTHKCCTLLNVQNRYIMKILVNVVIHIYYSNNVQMIFVFHKCSSSIVSVKKKRNFHVEYADGWWNLND